MITDTPASHSWAVRSLIRKLCNPLTLANIAVVALFIALSATSAAASPVKVQAPSIYGDPIEGKVINCSPGLWDNTEQGVFYSYSYQWRYDDTGQATPTSQDSMNYTVTAGDVGHALVCRVTATDQRDQSSSQADSAAVVAQGAPATVAVEMYSAHIGGDVGVATSGIQVHVELRRDSDADCYSRPFASECEPNVIDRLSASTNTAGKWSLELPLYSVAPGDRVVVEYSGPRSPPDANYYVSSPWPTYTPLSIAANGESLAGSSCSPYQQFSSSGSAQCRSVEVSVNGAAPTSGSLPVCCSAASKIMTFPAPVTANDAVTLTTTTRGRSGTRGTISELALTEDGPLPGGGFPGCDADLVTGVVGCKGLAPGREYDLQIGSSTPVGLSLVNPSAYGGVTGFAHLGALAPGDELRLRAAGVQRDLARWRLATLRLDVDGDAGTSVSGECTPQLRFGGTGALGSMLSSVTSGVCTSNGSVPPSVSSFYNQPGLLDEQSPNATVVRVPSVTTTSPTEGESIFTDAFRAYADVSYYASEQSRLVQTDDEAKLSVRPHGADAPANVEFGNANQAEGATVSGLAPDRYTATWKVIDANGDTSVRTSHFVVQQSPKGSAGPPGPVDHAAASGPPGLAGKPGPPGVAAKSVTRVVGLRCKLRGSRVRCRVRLSESRQATVRMKMTRGSRTYASGQGKVRKRGWVTLSARSRLGAGSYDMVINVRSSGSRPMTSTSRIRIRT